MADLVTRLLLDSKQFDNNIVKSSRQVQLFKEAGSKVVGMLGKFGGALGVAMGAAEAFDRAMNANLKNQLNWTTSLDASKRTVDDFFSALTSGDWSIFKNGVLQAISLNKEFSKSLKDVQRSLQIGDIRIGDKEASLDAKDTIINSNKYTAAEKEKAYKEGKAELESLKTDQSNQQKYAKSEVAKILTKRGIKGGNGRDLLLRYLDKSTGDFKQWMDYKQADVLASHLEGRTEINDSKGLADNAKKARQAANKLYKKEFDAAEKIWESLKPEDINAILEITDQANNLSSRVSTAENQVNSWSDKFNANGKYIEKKEKTVKVTPKITPKEVEEVYKPIQEALDATPLNAKIKFDKDKSLAELEFDRKLIVKRLNNSQSPDEYVKIKAELEAKDEQIESFKSGRGLKAPTFTPVKENPIVSPEKIKATDEWAESLNLVATAMGSISQMTNEGAAAWLTWGANIMTSVATAIPAIEAMIALKKEEAVANGAAEAAKTPFVGWLTVGAAVAAVAAAMFSIPKFATGGIVGGNSYSGDRIIAGLNSGEMVLNGALQRNLFNLINNGSKGSSQVEFKIRGKELVGVLNNYNKQTSRV